MSDLIAALQIFLKYKDVTWPTNCEHNVLYIMDVTKDEVSLEDRIELADLTFFWDEDAECWSSHHFGSA